MFGVEERERVRERLLQLAAADDAVVGAAVTGSHAVGGGDRWSDIDLVLAVSGPLDDALERWTRWLGREFGVLHHWDLPSGASVYRVFLLPGGLEVDLGFTPENEFGLRGPRWRLLFGAEREAVPDGSPSVDELAGLAWHHVLHARASIERRRWWQAEHWIGAARTQVIALACLRLGHPTAYAKGAHLLPAEITDALAPTLARSLDEEELRRVVGALVPVLVDELRLADAGLAARLEPALREAGCA